MRTTLAIISSTLFLAMGSVTACSGSTDAPVTADAGPDDAGGSSSGHTSTSSSSSSSSGSSSSSSSGSSTSSSSSSSSSGSPADAAASTCNALVQKGSPFDILTTKAPAPQPTGGTIADGTWIGTSGKIWGSSSPEGSKAGTAGSVTLEITGTTLQIVSTGATSGKVTRRTVTMATTDGGFTFTETCAYPADDAGAGPIETGTYSADATTLHFYTNAGGGSATLDFGFTKQ